MNPYDIIAAIYKAGFPPSRIARDLGKSRSAVSQVIRSKASSHNIATYISSVTNIPLSRLWTDGRYNRPPRQSRRKAA